MEQTITETLDIVFLGIPEWHGKASCRDPWHDPDDWFSVEGEVIERAIAVCRKCPVQYECLKDALEVNEPWGIRGAKTKNQRSRILKRLGWEKH